MTRMTPDQGTKPATRRAGRPATYPAPTIDDVNRIAAAFALTGSLRQAAKTIGWNRERVNRALAAFGYKPVFKCYLLGPEGLEPENPQALPMKEGR